MAMLTTRELAAVENQLRLENMLQRKYREAARVCTEPDTQALLRRCAEQHKKHYACLLNYLS